MRLTLTSEQDAATFIACDGEISQSQFPSSSFNPLEELLGNACYGRCVIVDLMQASFIDSSGIGWLLICHKQFRTTGGKMILHSVPPMVDQVLRVLQLHTVLNIKPDRAAALTAAMEGSVK